MLKDTFLHHMKEAKALRIGGYTLFYDPPSIVNYDIDMDVVFKNIEDLYENGMLGDRKLKDIWESEEDIFHSPLCMTVIDDSSLWFPIEEEYK